MSVLSSELGCPYKKAHRLTLSPQQFSPLPPLIKYILDAVLPRRRRGHRLLEGEDEGEEVKGGHHGRAVPVRAPAPRGAPAGGCHVRVLQVLQRVLLRVQA